MMANSSTDSSNSIEACMQEKILAEKIEALKQGPFFDDAHKLAVLSEADSYTDTRTGYLVWTELYHLRRGTCCQSTCRHCPFGYNT